MPARLLLGTEGEHQLLGEAVRHVVALHAVFFREAGLALDPGAEQAVREGAVGGVVLVDGDRVRPV
jgi:hypothetical protein